MDPAPNTVVIWLLIQLLLIALNAIFACAEIAIISMNDAKLSALAQKGDKRAVRLARLTSQPAKFLAVIQVAITLSGFLGSAFAADNFASLITNALHDRIPISPEALNTVSVIAITLILSYFTLVFGELVPKRIAMKKAEGLALALSGAISFISGLFAPLVWLLTVSTNGILRIFGIDPNEQNDEVTEEEIRMMVDVGSENGTIDEKEKQIIQNVFEFDDLCAGDIATHRTEICVLWADDELSEWENTVCESRHAFYPVCEGSIDNVIGVLCAADYLRLRSKSRESVLSGAVRPAYFVPESIKADLLFMNMKKEREFFAVVLDEYGGMSGIVTMTNLIECIVGDIYEDDEEGELSMPDIDALDDKSFRISGACPIEDASAVLGTELDDGRCDTFGGYVMSLLGIIPEDGSNVSVQTEDLNITVTDIKDHKIEQTIVTRRTKGEN